MCIAERERVGCLCLCSAGRRTGEIDWIGVKFEVKMKTLFEENMKKKDTFDETRTGIGTPAASALRKRCVGKAHTMRSVRAHYLALLAFPETETAQVPGAVDCILACGNFI